MSPRPRKPKAKPAEQPSYLPMIRRYEPDEEAMKRGIRRVIRLIREADAREAQEADTAAE